MDPVWSPLIQLRDAQGNRTTLVDGADLRALPRGCEILITVTGRVQVPLRKKLNPIWWVLNDWDRDPPRWYLPSRPGWYRRVYWWFRNPFHNFGRYVLGVCDRNYVMTITRRDGYQHVVHPDGGHEDYLVGWERGYISLGRSRLPWIAWGATSPMQSKFYAGWQPTGFAGLKFNGLGMLALPLLVPLLLWMLWCRMRSL